MFNLGNPMFVLASRVHRFLQPFCNALGDQFPPMFLYHLFSCLSYQKNYLVKKFVKELAPSPQQLLNEQGVRRISGQQKFEVRFGS